MVLLRKKRLVAVALETVVGTKETLAAGDADMNCYDAEVNPTIEFIRRPGQASLSQLPGLTSAQSGQITFKTDIHGAGAALPLWAQLLLPACGYVSGDAVSPWTFAPLSAGPTDGVTYAENRSATIGVYTDGELKQLSGAMGTFKIMLTAGQIAMIEWTFKGEWVGPLTGAFPATTYPTVLPARFMSTALLIDGSPPATCIETVEIDAGNNVVLRPCADQAGAIEGAVVTERNPVITMNPESVPSGTEDWYADWLSGAELPLVIPLISATNTITISAPKIQRTNIQEGDRSGIQIDNITWQANKNAHTGDDELTFTFAVT